MPMPEPDALVPTRRGVLAGGLAAALGPVPAFAAGGLARPRTGIRRFYEAGDGANLQPALQRAIDWAGAHGADIFSDLGAIKGEIWCPPAVGTEGAAARPTPLIVRHAMAINFAGATFHLKGPGGRDRMRGQSLGPNAQPWLGGWMRAIGDTGSGPGIDRLALSNVTVDGMFSGDVTTNRAANVSDKGFFLFDDKVREVVMHKVELRNFAGEVYYIGGPGPAWQEIVDCHFHGSPQCAWNPGGTGRVLAVNLRAGRAYQCAEVIGGRGHVYRGGHFYLPGFGGSSFFGGPSPVLPRGYPYWYAWWDGKGEPPWVRFEDTLFSGGQALNLGSWMKGRLRTIDTSVYLNEGVGHLRGVDLAIAAQCDWGNNGPAVVLQGIGLPRGHVDGELPDVRREPPSDIRLAIACSRSAAARARGRAFASALRYNGGAYDRSSVSVTVRGEARQMVEDGSRGKGPLPPPRARDAGFVAV